MTLPAGAIEDYYNNATTEPTTFSFTWPATDTILDDTRVACRHAATGDRWSFVSWWAVESGRASAR